MIGTVSKLGQRNVIGSHGGSYAVYRALAVSSGTLDPIRRPDLTNTYPAATIGPFPQWTDPEKIASLDPWGHLVADVFKQEIAEGLDIRPQHRHHPRATRPDRDAGCDCRRAAQARWSRRPREWLDLGGQDRDRPVWYLPGIAKRFGTTETALRRDLFEQTAGMFPELVTRPDLRVFLPPIGGTTVYLFGDMSRLTDPRTKFTCRVHDECNGSDVFGSDICTCRPYLIHGIEGVRPRRAAGRVRHHRLQPQGRPRARRGHQVPGLQRTQAPGGAAMLPRPISSAPNASPACRMRASSS